MLRSTWYLLFGALSMCLGGVVYCQSVGVVFDASEYQEYKEKIASLYRSQDSIVEEGGKKEIIRRYLEVIDAYPGFDRNIELEYQIGQVYMSFAPYERKECFDYWLSVTKRYDSNAPFMKTVRIGVAQLSSEFEPEKVEERFNAIMNDYPDDDALRLRCYGDMKTIAMQKGDWDRVETLASTILLYDDGGIPLSDRDRQYIYGCKSNACLTLLRLAEGRAGSEPFLRLVAVRDLVKKYPAIRTYRRDELERTLEGLESQTEIVDPIGSMASDLTIRDESLVLSGSKSSGATADTEVGSEQVYKDTPLTSGNEDETYHKYSQHGRIFAILSLLVVFSVFVIYITRRKCERR